LFSRPSTGAGDGSYSPALALFPLFKAPRKGIAEFGYSLNLVYFENNFSLKQSTHLLYRNQLVYLVKGIRKIYFAKNIGKRWTQPLYILETKN
jgi:hypothetical protein